MPSFAVKTSCNTIWSSTHITSFISFLLFIFRHYPPHPQYASFFFRSLGSKEDLGTQVVQHQREGSFSYLFLLYPRLPSLSSYYALHCRLLLGSRNLANVCSDRFRFQADPDRLCNIKQRTSKQKGKITSDTHITSFFRGVCSTSKSTA